jgi:DNA repair protein RadC
MKNTIYKQKIHQNQPLKGEIPYMSDEELMGLIFPGLVKKSDREDHVLQALCQGLEDAAAGFKNPFLWNIPGLSQTNKRRFKAIREMLHRLAPQDKIRIRHPEEAFGVLKPRIPRHREAFFLMSLGGAQEVIRTRLVSLGTANRSLVHPREVLSPLLRDRAISFLIAHNHPSGNLEPSPEDHQVTQRLSQLGDQLGIPLLDHLILSRENFYSFRQNGQLE